MDNEKILSIKKVLYDSKSEYSSSHLGNGTITDKGRVILKEIGIKPEDLEERLATALLINIGHESILRRRMKTKKL